jgi:Zn-dependent protease
MKIQGAFRLFRVVGIDVLLHWSWFLVAIIQIQHRAHSYSSPVWNVLEYLALFLIVLLHEFGHALACRSVGGKAETILLWPLGGIAMVSPPPRPGATLWSIAAGPLVNVVLMFLILGVGLALRFTGVLTDAPNLSRLLTMLSLINLVLLVFNLLPIYPLDGGQMLRSILWFFFGPSTSLIVAAIIGFVGVGLLVLLALWMQSVWMGIMCVFVLFSCWQGLQQGLAMMRMAKAPRRAGFACPSCGAVPRVYPFWMCGHCRTKFDTFETNARCPKCEATFELTRCIECGQAHPLSAWQVSAPPLPIAPPHS